MTILDFPTLTRDPSSANWGLTGRTQNQVSPFDGSTQSLTLPGSKWACTMNFGSLSMVDWRNLSQFIAQLNGMAGRFVFRPSWIHPRTAITFGTPLVNGAGQTGSGLITDGWTPSITIIQRGDFFSFTDSAGRLRLHQVIAGVAADGAGNATLAFSPPLRSAPADNAPLTITNPGAVFMLTDDSQGRFGFDGSRPDSAGGVRGQVSIDIAEALV